MAVKPTRRDGNRQVLHGHGTETITKRVTGITTAGSDISLTMDVKSLLIHVEGSTDVLYMTGTHADSEEIHLTSDGFTFSDFDVVVEENTTIITLAAPADTIDVSIIGWT